MSAKKRKPDAATLALADGLHSTAIHLLRRLRRVDEATGLTAPKMSVLSVLVFGGPCSLGKLASVEQIRPPSMTKLIQGLERQGLVARRAAPMDRRSSLIRATPKGIALLKHGRSRRVSELASWMSALSRSEAAALRNAVEALKRLLNPIGQGSESPF